MNIYVYSDESGVFDKIHNDYFVYAGLIFIDKKDRDLYARKYSNAEKTIRKKYANSCAELKASVLKNYDKLKLYKVFGNCFCFAGVINQNLVLDNIFLSKKDKQRYLDYVYKMSVKNAFIDIIKMSHIIPNEVENLYFFIDEHTTATNGKYELCEALEQEFKYGTYNYNYNKYYPPIFPNLKSVNLKFCDSNSVLLIRGADIIANRVYYLRRTNEIHKLNNFSIKHFPK